MRVVLDTGEHHAVQGFGEEPTKTEIPVSYKAGMMKTEMSSGFKGAPKIIRRKNSKKVHLETVKHQDATTFKDLGNIQSNLCRPKN